jgi:hypothetical protein
MSCGLKQSAHLRRRKLRDLLKLAGSDNVTLHKEAERVW